MAVPAPKVESEVATLMKALAKRGKSPARMQTWYCPEDRQYHVLVGRVGCETCGHYEKRVELDNPALPTHEELLAQ